MEPRVINTSPWLYGLKRERPVIRLKNDTTADVVVVGAGIAGVSSAYFLLTRTDKSVVVIDRLRVADGSTGYNAGTATPIFERSLQHFVELFGADRVRGGMRAVEDAWGLLQEVYAFAEGMDIPVSVNGYFGYRTPEDVAPVIVENGLRASLGIPTREVFYAEELQDTLPGPLAHMPGLSFVPVKDIASHLRTNDTRLAAAVVEHEALVNTASLCEKTVTALLKAYPERFKIYEESEVTKITSTAVGAVARTATAAISAGKVVLATNAYEKFTLENGEGVELNTRFHKSVGSRLAYMLGIFMPEKKADPGSLAYIFKPEDEHGISFEYVTERPYSMDGVDGTLFTIGGPDFVFNHELVEYGKDTPFRQGVFKEMERFLEHHYGLSLKDKTYFQWHGLLAYTETNARLVGADPKAPNLLYNLGCNGVGILLSLWGGMRLADTLLGKELSPTMFDPPGHFDGAS
ncbi:MAG: hypothetical protein RLZZ283_119 [Candidatus Parcubacteria bacterium]